MASMSQPVDEQPDEPITKFEEQAQTPSYGLAYEFWLFLKYNKKWWLTPIIVVLLLLTLLVFLAGTGAAPFIYPIF